MKKTKNTIILTLILVLFFSCLVYAKSKSGTCGKNVKWSLNSSGTLTIKGRGAMKSYIKKNIVDELDIFTKRPWYKYRSSIKKIVIKKGVTSVGEAAFVDLDKVTSVSIAKTVKQIGSYSFAGCTRIEKISIPEGVKTIDAYAFHYCPKLKKVILPKSLTWIDIGMFGVEHTFKHVYYRGSKKSWKERCDDDEYYNYKVHYNYKGK